MTKRLSNTMNCTIIILLTFYYNNYITKKKKNIEPKYSSYQYSKVVKYILRCKYMQVLFM